MPLERLTEAQEIAAELDDLAAQVERLGSRRPGNARVKLRLAEARAALLALVGEIDPKLVLNR